MRFYGSDLKIEAGRLTVSGRLRCLHARRPRATVVGEPVVIFEVLSDSTARTEM